MPDLTDLPDAKTVFGLVDSKNLPGLLLLMAPDARFTMGNQPTLHGHEQIAAANDAFFRAVTGVRHDIRHEWTVGDDTIAETQVTYTRLDGTELTVPAVSIWTVGGHGLITDYRVFIDHGPLFGGQA